MNAEMTPEEVKTRAAVLSRFREMLQTQRDRFRDYLEVLEKQQKTIEQGDTEALLAQVDLEEHLLRDISNIQKVIDPLEDLYRRFPGPAPEQSGEEETRERTRSLKASLAALKQEAAARTARNRDLLAKRMTEVRSELTSLRGNPYAARRSIYADTVAPSLIDVKG